MRDNRRDHILLLFVFVTGRFIYRDRYITCLQLRCLLQLSGSFEKILVVMSLFLFLVNSWQLNSHWVRIYTLWIAFWFR